jgi:hypothetical protein
MKNITIALVLIVIAFLVINLYLKQLHNHIRRQNRNTTKTIHTSPFKFRKVHFEDEFNGIRRHFYNNYCEEAFTRARDKLDIEESVPSVIKPFRLYLDRNARLNFTIVNNTALDYLGNLLDVKRGGRWAPTKCQARHRIALIIPYRDREENLNIFLFNIHTFLQRQELNYAIFVVEQTNEAHFNKGILMNAAYNEIVVKNRFNLKFDCIIYHDVDVICNSEM